MSAKGCDVEVRLRERGGGGGGWKTTGRVAYIIGGFLGGVMQATLVVFVGIVDELLAATLKKHFQGGVTVLFDGQMQHTPTVDVVDAEEAIGTFRVELQHEVDDSVVAYTA